jgi:ABC-2 type transport system ATP-binding protein
VDDVSFEIPEGGIFGMLGPNGAGKTSIIRIITTITRADSGKVWLGNQELSEKLATSIGYMPEERGLYKKMKVGEQLMYLGQLKGMSYADARKEIIRWLEKFEIQGWWDKRIDELSKGMQQKVQFIATVLHRPQLLILDEPFTGLDPINAALLQEEIYELHRNGTTIIFSTHRMEQVEEICDSIVLINKGKNVLEGNVKKIRQLYRENVYEICFSGAQPPSLLQMCAINSEISEGRLRIKINEGVASNTILKTFLENGNHILSFNEKLPTLNEIFIRTVDKNSAKILTAN